MKKMIWLIALAVSVVLMSCATDPTIPVGPQQQEGDFTWGRSRDGNSAVITGHVGNSANIRIPSEIQGLPVTIIAPRAFSANRLTGVNIPDSVLYIGRGAFQTNRLLSVAIPDSVTYIGRDAFFNNQLSSIIIPDSVTDIGDRAFQNNRLASIAIGNGVTNIGNHAFRNNNLVSVTIGSHVVSIGDHAFRRNNLVSVIIPNSVIRIGNYAFQNNQLASITIGSSVSSIGARAFHGNQLTSVTIPDNVIYVGMGAFLANYPLESVTIIISSEESEWAGGAIFSGDRLTSITLTGGQTAWSATAPKGMISGNGRNISRIILESDGGNITISGSSRAWRGFLHANRANVLDGDVTFEPEDMGEFTFSGGRWNFQPRDSMPTLPEPEPPADLMPHPYPPLTAEVE